MPGRIWADGHPMKTCGRTVNPIQTKSCASGDFVMGIARLLNLVAQEQGNLAVMCAEGDPLQCHRHTLIARALLDPSARLLQGDIDLTVQHILPDGTLVPSAFG